MSWGILPGNLKAGFLPQLHFMESPRGKAITKHCQNWKQNKSHTAKNQWSFQIKPRLNQIKLALSLNFKPSQNLVHLTGPIVISDVCVNRAILLGSNWLTQNPNENLESTIKHKQRKKKLPQN